MIARLFWLALGAIGLALAASTAAADVWLSSYSFAPNNLPTISSNDSLSSMYKLRFKVNGAQYENKWNNNGQRVDSAPSPGTYTAQLYYLQYDSTGSNLLTIGPMANQTVTVLSPVNGASWYTTGLPGTGTPGSQITFYPVLSNSGNTLWDGNYFIDLQHPSGNHTYTTLATTAPGYLKTALFTITLPSSAGVYTYNFTALQANVAYFGSTVSASITVNTNPTTSLSLSSTSITVGQSVTATSTTTDPDGNLINQAIDYLPPGGGSWVSGTSGNGFRWDGAATSSNTVSNSRVLNSVGTWQFRARGADNLGGISNFSTMNVTVSAPAPVITSSTSASGTYNSAFSYTITASNSPTSFAASNLAGTGLSLNTSTGLISGTPSAAGTITSQLTASNTNGTSSPVTLTITIGKASQPAVTISPTSQTVTAPASINFTAGGGGGGGAWVWTGASGSGSTATGTFNTAGTYTVSVSRNGDGNYNGSNTANATITVSAALPPAPVVSSGSTSGTAGTVCGGYQISATNSPNSYGATGLPPGLNVNTSTGYISGTPTTAGTYNAVISATNAGGTGTATLTITISAAASPELNVHLPIAP